MAKEKRKILLMDDIVEDTVIKFVRDCDADMLAHITETCFGGKCSFIDGHFEFVTDDNYTGAFDGIET